jgi:hypothetical protein
MVALYAAHVEAGSSRPACLAMLVAAGAGVPDVPALPGSSHSIGEIIDPITRRLIAYTLTGLFESANRTI